MSDITETLAEICSLAEQLQEQDLWWHFRKSPPAALKEVRDCEYRLQMKLPKELKECLQMSNGIEICFDYPHSVLSLYSLEAICRMTDDPKKERIYFGHAGYEMYFHRTTGKILIEHERYQYDETEDFHTEVLQTVLLKMQNALMQIMRRDALLACQQQNPYRKYYDQLLSIYQQDQSVVTFCPPATEHEIVEWEKKNNAVLPQAYKDWLMLSNGSQFGHKHLLSLEQIETYRSSPVYRDGVEYLTLVLLTGCFDHLMCNSQTGEMCILTEDFEWEELWSFDGEVFEEEIEYILNP